MPQAFSGAAGGSGVESGRRVGPAGKVEIQEFPDEGRLWPWGETATLLEEERGEERRK